MCGNYIMHSVDMQAIRSPVHLVRTPLQDPANNHQNPANNRCLRSRSRSRRT